MTAPLADQLDDAHGSREDVIAERGGVGGVLVGHDTHDAELVTADVHDVLLVEGRVRDGLPVDERAVAAAEVADPQREPVGVDLRVVLRDVGRGQHQRQAGGPADPERERAQRRVLDAGDLARAALEHPETGRAHGGATRARLVLEVGEAEALRVAGLPERRRCPTLGHALTLREPAAGPAGSPTRREHSTPGYPRRVAPPFSPGEGGWRYRMLLESGLAEHGDVLPVVLRRRG